MVANTVFKTVPKAPKDYDKEMVEMWKSACGRFLELGFMYKADAAYVDLYCRSYRQWQKIQAEADMAGTFDERLRVNDLLRFCADLAAKTRQNYRALEGTVLDRQKAGQAGTGVQGGRVGVRQLPSREGVNTVPSAKKVSSGGVSWLDDARKRSAK